MRGRKVGGGARGGGQPAAAAAQPRPLPDGFRIELDPATRQLSGDVLFGGSPARALRLSAAGRAALAELRAGPVCSAAGGALARRLTDAGLAHPRPPAAAAAADVTVLIPVRDRPQELDRCLAALGGIYPVLVVDDGSADQAATAAVAARHGATLIRRPVAGGPASARNTGLAAIGRVAPGTGALGPVPPGPVPPGPVPPGPVPPGPVPPGRAASAAVASGTGAVALLDSDCVPPPDWIAQLAAHLADPLVGAVAPRVVPASAAVPRPGHAAGAVPRPDRAAGAVPRPDQEAGSESGSDRAVPSSAARYAAARGTLDLGGSEARMVPMTKVSYVPTAALLVRRSALDSVARDDGAIFDPALRYGEDVDLVWRLHDRGWRIRYEPAVQVRHDDPDTWPGLLGRRFRYGTSAAPLSRRHPGQLAPLVLHPWPAAVVAAALARRPVLAAAAAAGSWVRLTRAVRAAGLPADGVTAAAATAVRQTWLGTARYATQFACPALLLAVAAPGGKTRAVRWGRRAAAAGLLLGPALDAGRKRERTLDPIRFTAGCVADDVAYGAGVWAGCVRARTLTPLRPKVAWRPLRVTRERNAADGQHLV
jgi:mycofactocin glycosyltransferase